MRLRLHAGASAPWDPLRLWGVQGGAAELSFLLRLGSSLLAESVGSLIDWSGLWKDFVLLVVPEQMRHMHHAAYL